MGRRLIGVTLTAQNARSRRTWTGCTWWDPEDRTDAGRLEVPRDFVRLLTTAHSVTIHLLPQAGNRDKRPAVRDG